MGKELKIACYTATIWIILDTYCDHCWERGTSCVSSAVLKQGVIVGHLPQKMARTMQELSTLDQRYKFVIVHVVEKFPHI